jgi:retron-type reverse transcriptase
MFHLESEKLLHDSQFGFRKLRSTENALLYLQDLVTSALDGGQFSTLVLLDISKAFDSVNIDILLYKLKHYGASQNTLDIFHSYLTGRKIRTLCNGVLSGMSDIGFGVPQGSVLGPILFLLFFNDIFFLDLKSKLVTYADDTTLLHCSNDPLLAQTELNHDLKLISDWFHDNRLLLNIDKSNYINVKCKNDRRKVTGIHVNNVALKYKNNVKLLGVVLDEFLSFSYHTDLICS